MPGFRALLLFGGAADLFQAPLAFPTVGGRKCRRFALRSQGIEDAQRPFRRLGGRIDAQTAPRF
jgi:hypothetical protein